MATITKRGDGQWQAKVLKKGYSVQSKTFKTKVRAKQWARNVESEMGRCVFLSISIAENTLLSELIDRYLTEVAPSKEAKEYGGYEDLIHLALERPLSSKAIEVIERQPHHITGFLFPVRSDSVTRAFSRVCQNAKIKDLRFHGLRHEATRIWRC